MKRKIIQLILFLLAASFVNAQSHWSFDNRQYANNMTVTGIVLLNGTALQNSQIEIAAFSGNECRGTQFLQQNGNNWICYLMAYGDNGGEPITFRVYDHQTSIEYTASNSEEFQVNAIFGNSVTPYSINIAVTYNISYNLNGGSGANTGTYSSEGATLPTPTKDGYTFGGWYANATFEGSAITNIPAGSIGDKTFYAKWNIVNYNITYNVNGGSAVSNGTYNIESSEITLPAPTKDGYTFGGWYANATFEGSAITSIAAGSIGDKTFYAKWNLVTYNITYNVNGGSAVNNGTYNIESSEITLPAPTKDGYDFGGWYANATFEGSAITNIPAGSIGDKTFYAKWNIVTYNITYNVNGGSAVSNGTYNIESSEITLPTPTKDGYTFGGWYANATFEGSAITNIPAGSIGDKTFYAKWNIITYNITYNVNGGSAVNNGTYNIESSEITLPAPTRDGYTFGGWYASADFSGGAVTGIAAGSIGDKTFYAKWNLVTYNITYNVNGGSTVSNGTYNIESSEITLPTPTRDGYTFGGWYANATFEGGAVTNIPAGSIGDKTFYAKWMLIVYFINYELNGGTNHSDNPATYTVESPKITLRNPTRQDYTFDGWAEGDTIAAGSIGDKTFTAQWTLANGISGINADVELIIYPNPAIDNITVDIQDIFQKPEYPNNVTITDLTGRVVVETRHATSLQNRIIIDVCHLSAGTYIVRVGNKIGKLIKK
jgi:uncharacterized repeat protein (TIGR02543 family)